MSNISHVRLRRQLTFDPSWEWRWIRCLARQYTAELGGKDIVLSVQKLLMLRKKGSSVAVRPRKMIDSPKWYCALVRLDPLCHMAGSVYLAYFGGVVENTTYEAVLRNADYGLRFINVKKICSWLVRLSFWQYFILFVFIAMLVTFSHITWHSKKNLGFHSLLG